MDSILLLLTRMWWVNKVVLIGFRQRLHPETESIILAVQDQVIATRVIESKVMRKSIPSLLQSLWYSWGNNCAPFGSLPYTCRYSILASLQFFAAVIHWHLMRFYSFQSCRISWYGHRPLSVIESPTTDILWDLRLATNCSHPSNFPDTMLYDFYQQEIYFIEI